MGCMLNSRNEGLWNVSYEKWNYPVDPYLSPARSVRVRNDVAHRSLSPAV